MENIQFITIPVNEWQNLKRDLQIITTEILALKQKNSKEFLTIKEAMQVLKCSRNTLQNYIDSGRLNTHTTTTGIYKKVLIRNADIEYFLKIIND